jgi:hypothetical protein
VQIDGAFFLFCFVKVHRSYPHALYLMLKSSKATHVEHLKVLRIIISAKCIKATHTE